MADDTVIEQIADLLVADRLHIHAKEMETIAAGGTAESDQSVAFPLADRQSRESAPPPPAADPRLFPKVDPSAQAAALVAAASQGQPFCLE